MSKGVGQHAHDVLVDAKKHGLEMLVGGPDDAFNGTIKPTVVMEPRDPARIVDEETFGPSASLYVVEDDAEAIKVANATSYGLNATIHSWNMERALKMARHLDYGQVHINSTTTYSSRKLVMCQSSCKSIVKVLKLTFRSDRTNEGRQSQRLGLTERAMGLQRVPNQQIRYFSRPKRELANDARR